VKSKSSPALERCIYAASCPNYQIQSIAPKNGARDVLGPRHVDSTIRFGKLTARCQPKVPVGSAGRPTLRSSARAFDRPYLCCLQWYEDIL